MSLVLPQDTRAEILIASKRDVFSDPKSLLKFCDLNSGIEQGIVYFTGLFDYVTKTFQITKLLLLIYLCLLLSNDAIKIIIMVINFNKLWLLDYNLQRNVFDENIRTSFYLNSINLLHYI